jgi:DNA ligase D-like protein (predicted 3'-phosphoesterase)
VPADRLERYRFEIDGVLVSWAVPRGPTIDPSARRMAVHVEDHPIEYLDFEGVIPAGEYGGGDVIVWDIGTWEPHATDDPAAAVAGGELHVDVFGEKLRGRLVLVRRGGPVRSGDREQWLLHKKDEHAVDGWDPEDHPRSVVSGRTNEEVRADPDKLWRSDAPAARAAAIAPVVPPYLRGRALNRHRFPNGAEKPGFWHKALPGHAPDWLPRWDDPEADRGSRGPTSSSTSPPRWCGRPASARSSGTPGRR